MQTETFPVLKGSVSQLGAKTGVQQEGPPQQAWMGMLRTCFSSSSQVGQDQQLGDGNPSKGLLSPKPFVPPAMWGSTETGAATGVLGVKAAAGAEGSLAQGGKQKWWRGSEVGDST